MKRAIAIGTLAALLLSVPAENSIKSSINNYPKVQSAICYDLGEYRGRTLDLMADGIEMQESGNGGLMFTLENILVSFGDLPFIRKEVRTIGHHQINKRIAYKIISGWNEKTIKNEFGVNSIEQLTENMLIDYLMDPEKSKFILGCLMNDNAKIMKQYHMIAGINPPDIGTISRILFDSTAYNNGVLRPMIAGFQKSMHDIGIDLPYVKTKDDRGKIYETRFDGYLGKQTSDAFCKWLSIKHQKGQYMTLGIDEARNTFKMGLRSVLKSQIWDIIYDEHLRQTGKKPSLLVPFDVADSEKYGKEFKFMNYGLRVTKYLMKKDFFIIMPTRYLASAK